VGSSIPGFAGSHDIEPKTVADGSRINYDWPLVNDNQLYCYDTLLIDLNNGPGDPDPNYMGDIVLLQLSGPSLDTLTIELQSPNNTCSGVGMGSWAFTGNAVTFQR
jgi:hypothetical protein